MIYNRKDAELTESFKMFGKQYCDLTAEEKREYNRIRKRKSRENDPLMKEKNKKYYQENKEWLLEAGKEWRQNNVEKTREYSKNHYQNKHKNDTPFQNSITTKMFGKRYNQLTDEERREYNRIRANKRYQKIREQRLAERSNSDTTRND